MNECYEFQLEPLTYDYSALEPYIIEKIMKLHHDKHYKAYVDKLNSILKEYPRYQSWSLLDFVVNYKMLPVGIQTEIKNSSGGVYNHKLFFRIMGPDKVDEPFGNTASEIMCQYGSYENFKKVFKDAALNIFGSGWAWLVINKNCALEIVTTPNQDNPLACNLYPILLLDMWEHAYYLQYKNMRGEYIDNWFNTINWKEVENRYNNFINKKTGVY